MADLHREACYHISYLRTFEKFDKIMKQIILLVFFLAFAPAYAQVPRQDNDRGRDGGIRVDEYPLEVMEGPHSKKAADEVTGYYNAANGKKGFRMGDDSKKEAIYDQINFTWENNSYIVKSGNLYGITNNKGVVIVKIAYDSIGDGSFNNVGFIAKKNGKYGKISATGEILLPLKYNKIIGGNEHITLVKNSKNETVLVFNKENKAFAKKIEYIEIYKNLAIIKSEGKFGIAKNEMVVQPEYDSIFVSVNTGSIYYNKPKSGQKVKLLNPLLRTHQDVTGLTLQKDKKLGLADSNGTLLYPAENDEVNNNDALGYITVKKGNLFGIYFSKSKDKKKTNIEFDRVSADGYGAIMASKNKKMGIFSLDGMPITDFEYDNDFIAQLSGIGYRISKDKKRGIVDKQGKVIVAPIYDDVDTFSFDNREALKVKLGEKIGVVNLKGEVIVPVIYDFIDELNKNYRVIIDKPERKVGLIARNGTVILPAENKWIGKSPGTSGPVLLLNYSDYEFNFLDKDNKLILPQNVSEYGYLLDEYKLKNAMHNLLYVKTKEGKMGLLHENEGKLAVPLVYDEIIQCITSGRQHTYYSVKKGKKSGLINEKNEVVIPIVYDVIDLDFAVSDTDDYQVVVAKGNKFGSVNLKNEIVIPFQYSALKRISTRGLFKAKTGKLYQVIDKDGKLISKNTFDEVANFEFTTRHSNDMQGLTFSKGKMRVMDDKGNFISQEKEMQPPAGYETFDELKNALVKAMDSKEDVLLKEFANKIAPSEATLYYLKQNIFDQEPLYVNVEQVKEKYFNDLLRFKNNEWHANEKYGKSGYNRSSLNVVDYTQYSDRYGMITNIRKSDEAYGHPRLMEKILRNSVKINGYWISSYFMNRGFNAY